MISIPCDRWGWSPIRDASAKLTLQGILRGECRGGLLKKQSGLGARNVRRVLQYRRIGTVRGNFLRRLARGDLVAGELVDLILLLDNEIFQLV
jgi:hypothetical protein